MWKITPYVQTEKNFLNYFSSSTKQTYFKLYYISIYLEMNLEGWPLEIHTYPIGIEAWSYGLLRLGGWPVTNCITIGTDSYDAARVRTPSLRVFVVITKRFWIIILFCINTQPTIVCWVVLMFFVVFDSMDFYIYQERGDKNSILSNP